MIEILFIDNEGGGICDKIKVDSGSTPSSVFKLRKADKDLDNYHVSLNGRPNQLDVTLRDNDTVSVTAKKVVGYAS